MGVFAWSRSPGPLPARAGSAVVFRGGSLGGALGLKPETARVRATVDQTASSNQLKMTILFSDPNADLDKCRAYLPVEADILHQNAPRSSMPD